MGQAVMAVVPWWNEGEQRTTWRKKRDLQAGKKLSRCGKSRIACNPRQFMMGLQGRGNEKERVGKCEDYGKNRKADVAFT